MRFVLLLKSTQASEAGLLASKELMAAMDAYNDALVRAGVLLDCAGLHPSSGGIRIDFSPGVRTMTDGPFPEVRQLIAGFWMIQVKSREEAIEWARRCPIPPGSEDSQVELRQAFEPADFVAAPREREEVFWTRMEPARGREVD